MNPIQSALDQNRMTKTALAQAMGVSRKSVHKWIKGHPPTYLHMQELAQILKCEVDDLFDRDIITRARVNEERRGSK